VFAVAERYAFAADESAGQRAQAKAADAKVRIAIYGSDAVIEKMAKFEEVGAILHNSVSRGASQISLCK
jgi:hypothetical protein